MNERLSERERITNKIMNIKPCDEADNSFIPCKKCCQKLADWHLAEVKRIVEPLVNAMNKPDADIVTIAYRHSGAIMETLKRVGGE